MSTPDLSTIFWMGLLVLIVGAIVAFYAWAIVNRTRALHRAMIALRDRIDGSNDPR